MKKKAEFPLFLAISALFLAFLSCRHTAQLVNSPINTASAAEMDGQYIAGQKIAGIAAASITIEVTPEQEYFIGRAMAAKILSTYRIWDANPVFAAYLNKICMAIAVNSPGPVLFNGYRVAILDSCEINSFSTPGGHIFLTKGLISAARSEDALAGAIAHEIAHIRLQHGINAIKESLSANPLFISGVIADIDNRNVLIDAFSELIDEVVNVLVNNGYSQELEFSADILALSLLAGAGYCPSGLLELLEELEKIHGDCPEGFDNTHPSPSRRIANIQRFIDNYTAADTRLHRQPRFNAMMKSL